MKRDFYVYVILDPLRTGRMEFWPLSFLMEPFYIGKGRRHRVLHHRYDKAKTPKALRWQSIVAQGIRPEIAILADNLTEADAFALERYFISQIGRADKGQGPLTNQTAGGQGTSGRSVSAEFRQRMSDRHKGVPKLHLRGRKRDPEIGRKISEARKGYKPSAETIAKMAATKRGKPNLAARGRKMPAHVQEAIRIGVQLGKQRRALTRPPPRSSEEIEAARQKGRFKKGQPPHNKGKTGGCMSEEQREKRRGKCAPGTLANLRAMAEARRGIKRPESVGRAISAAKRGKPNVKARGIPIPPHVIEAMQAGITRRRSLKRAIKACTLCP